MKYYIRKIEMTDIRRSAIIAVRRFLDRYYGLEQLEQDRIYIVGREWGYPEINYNISGMVNKIFRSISEGIKERLTDEFFVTNGLDLNNDQDVSKVIKDLIQESCNNFLAFPRTLSNREINTIIRLIDVWEKSAGDNEALIELIKTILPIIYNESFSFQTIYGKNAGEETTCIYPTRLKNKISYIESLYFAKGNEFMFINMKFSSKEEYEKYVYTNWPFMKYWTEYTDLYDEKDIKAWAAKILNCLPTEVEIVE